MNPDWTPPTQEDEKLGRLDRISCGNGLADHGRARIHSDWLPWAPGTRFPLPFATHEEIDPQRHQGDLQERIEGIANLRFADGWELITPLDQPVPLAAPHSRYGPVVSPDGRHVLALAMDCQHQIVHRLPHGYPVLTLGVPAEVPEMASAFTPDGRCVLVREQPGWVTLVDLECGPQPNDPRYRVRVRDEVMASACAFTPRPLVALACGNQVRVYDMASGQRLQTWDGPACWLRIHPGNGLVYAMSWDRALAVVDPDTGVLRASGESIIDRGEFTADGSWLITSGERCVRVLDAHALPETETVVFEFGADILQSAPSPRLALAVANGGRSVLASGLGGQCGIWSLDFGARSAKLQWTGEAPIQARGFPLADRFVFLTHGTVAFGVRQAIGEEFTPPANRRQLIRDVAFTPDSLRMLTDTGMLLSTLDASEIHDFGCSGPAAITPDGRFGFIGDDNAILRLLLEPPWTVTRVELDRGRIGKYEHSRGSVSADGRVGLVGQALFDVDPPAFRRWLPGTQMGESQHVLSRDGRFAAALSNWRIAREFSVVDCETGAEWDHYLRNEHIVTLGFTADSQYLAVACRSGRVRWYPSSGGRALRKPPVDVSEVIPQRDLGLLAQFPADLHPRVSPDGRKLVSREGACSLLHRCDE